MSSVAQIAEPFVCGGSAATFASCVIHPMDLAKVCSMLNVLSVNREEKYTSNKIRTELNASLIETPC